MAANKYIYTFQAIYNQLTKPAAGRTKPRYCTYFGVGFPDGNNKKGRKRVSMVPIMTIKIVIIRCVNVILHHRLSASVSLKA